MEVFTTRVELKGVTPCLGEIEQIEFTGHPVTESLIVCPVWRLGFATTVKKESEVCTFTTHASVTPGHEEGIAVSVKSLVV